MPRPDSLLSLYHEPSRNHFKLDRARIVAVPPIQSTVSAIPKKMTVGGLKQMLKKQAEENSPSTSSDGERFLAVEESEEEDMKRLGLEVEISFPIPPQTNGLTSVSENGVGRALAFREPDSYWSPSTGEAGDAEDEESRLDPDSPRTQTLSPIKFQLPLPDSFVPFSPPARSESPKPDGPESIKVSFSRPEALSSLAAMYSALEEPTSSPGAKSTGAPAQAKKAAADAGEAAKNDSMSQPGDYSWLVSYIDFDKSPPSSSESGITNKSIANKRPPLQRSSRYTRDSSTSVVPGLDSTSSAAMSTSGSTASTSSMSRTFSIFSASSALSSASSGPAESIMSRKGPARAAQYFGSTVSGREEKIRLQRAKSERALIAAGSKPDNGRVQEQDAVLHITARSTSSASMGAGQGSVESSGSSSPTTSNVRSPSLNGPATSSEMPLSSSPIPTASLITSPYGSTTSANPIESVRSQASSSSARSEMDLVLEQQRSALIQIWLYAEEEERERRIMRNRKVSSPAAVATGVGARKVGFVGSMKRRGVSVSSGSPVKAKKVAAAKQKMESGDKGETSGLGTSIKSWIMKRARSSKIVVVRNPSASGKGSEESNEDVADDEEEEEEELMAEADSPALVGIKEPLSGLRRVPSIESLLNRFETSDKASPLNVAA